MAAIGGGDAIERAVRLLESEIPRGSLDESEGLEALRRLPAETADVEDNCWRLARGISLMRPWSGESYPCVQLGIGQNLKTVPVDILDLFGRTTVSGMARRSMPDFRSAPLEGFADGLEMIVTDVKTSVRSFLDGVRATMRQRGPHQAPPSESQMTQGWSSSNFGLAYTVHTKRSRGRVFRSDAYYFRTANFFGALTTPVSGSVLPGYHVFGVQYPNRQIQWDPAIFAVPGADAVLGV